MHSLDLLSDYPPVALFRGCHGCNVILVKRNVSLQLGNS